MGKISILKNGDINQYRFLKSTLKMALFLCCMSLVFILLSKWSVFRSCIYNDIMLFEILYSFSKFICEEFNPAIISLLGIVGTIIVIFIKGENKHYYLQLRTFYIATNKIFEKHMTSFFSNKVTHCIKSFLCNRKHMRKLCQEVVRLCVNFKSGFIRVFSSGTWFSIILFVFSFMLEVYSADNEHVYAASFAALSILLLISSFIYYSIRYNNEKTYFLKEQCSVIMHHIQNRADWIEYVSLILPEIPTEYNSLESDVNLFKLLISELPHYNYHVGDEYKTLSEFASDKKNEKPEHIVTFFKKNEELRFEKTMNNFDVYIIPFVVFLSKTYRNTRGRLIQTLQKELTAEFNDSTLVNKTLRYLLMVVSRQFIIENDESRDYVLLEELEQIERWLLFSEEEFFQVYEKYDYKKLCDPQKSKIYYHIYSEYITQLHLYEMLQVSTYALQEFRYMNKHKSIQVFGAKTASGTYQSSYNIAEIVFFDKMKNERNDKKCRM